MTDTCDRVRLGRRCVYEPEHPGSCSFTKDVDDEEVRAAFRAVITFVATAKASHSAKSDALDAIQKLQARLLP